MPGALEAAAASSRFRLGPRTMLSDRLLIPEKLYGREDEISRAGSRPSIGSCPTARPSSSSYPAIPASESPRIVNELHKAADARRAALFAAGKFDQYKRDIPYATLAQAFQGLVGQLLSKSDDELSRWKTALTGALGRRPAHRQSHSGSSP